MITTKNAVMYGRHTEKCYFYLRDHQLDFDFYGNPEHKNMLFEAWNARVDG